MSLLLIRLSFPFCNFLTINSDLQIWALLQLKVSKVSLNYNLQMCCKHCLIKFSGIWWILFWVENEASYETKTVWDENSKCVAKTFKYMHHSLVNRMKNKEISVTGIVWYNLINISVFIMKFWVGFELWCSQCFFSGNTVPTPLLPRLWLLVYFISKCCTNVITRSWTFFYNKGTRRS